MLPFQITGLFGREYRTRSTCTYVQSDLAVQSLLLYQWLVLKETPSSAI